MSILKLLRLFLRLGVEGEGDPPADPPADAGDPPADDDPSLDDLIDDGAADADPPADDPPALRAERRRREQAEADLENERAARRQAANAAPTQPARDPEFEAEERRLQEARATNDPRYVELVQWQIANDRNNRQIRRESQNALAESRDRDDRASFREACMDNPQMAKYKAKVEETIADLRAKGQTTPPREALAAFLLGKDILAAKAKPGAKAKTPSGPNVVRIDRGRGAGPRTDVGAGSGKMSDHQKRIERLRNQSI